MAAVDLPLPRPGLAPGAIVPVDAAGWSLWIFDAGLACCAVECAAALRRLPGPGADAAAAGTGPAAAGTGPAAAGTGPAVGQRDRVNVLVVAGTVTDKLAPLVLRAYQAVPEPKRVLSFGACSNTGGPYWDSYCVTKGVDQFVPVDLYVPGCPPRPEALLQALDLLSSRGEAGTRREGEAGTMREDDAGTMREGDA